MAAGLVEEHPAAAGPDDHGHLAAGRRDRVELGDGPAGRPTGQVVYVDPIEEFESDRVAHRLATGLHAGVAGRHT